MDDNADTRDLSLIWVFTDALADQLDSASWLEPTKELRARGWEVSLITAGPAGQESIKGVPVITIHKPNIYLISQVIFHIRVLGFIARRWRRTKVILFHQMSAPWILPLRWVRKLLRQPFPLIVMDTRTAPMIPKAASTRRDRVRRKFDILMNRVANKTTDGQTAITVRMAEMMAIPDAKLLGVWPSGVLYQRFASAQEKRNWRLTGQEVHMIYIGALHVQRNLLNFCKAIEEANATGKSFKFSMAGWGTDRENLAAFAANTDGRITVMPPIPHEDIPDLLAEAHVGVLPFPDQARFRVSSPIKLFEYMAAGLPIFATRIVCHTDVIGEDKFAFWVDGSDQASFLAGLNQVWENRHALPQMAEKASLAAQSWTWKASAAKLNNALKLGIQQQLTGRERRE